MGEQGSGFSGMSFRGASVARAYDRGLVPVLFLPWARRLVAEHGPWAGRTVLDLATGTGVVARELADAVGPDGAVVAVDLNAAMLALARERCAGGPQRADGTARVRFLESPAAPLALADASVDVAVCQQGLQFFPDRAAAAAELNRVLRPGGPLVVTTWLPVERCVFFGAVCASCEALGLDAVSAKMRVPFDHVADGELPGLFEAAGFDAVREVEQADEMVFDDLEHAVRTAWATPIGADLEALPEAGREAFRAELAGRLEVSGDGRVRALAATRLLTARRPG